MTESALLGFSGFSGGWKIKDVALRNFKFDIAR